MRRRLPTAIALIVLAGCQSVQEQEALRPLRDNGPQLTYEELLLRARRQSDLATDRAFRDNWADVQDVSAALEQTVRLIPTAPEVPAKKTEIVRLTKSIEGEAKKLGQAAKEVTALTGTDREKKIKEVDAILTKIGRDVRTLWASN
jgi:hypothetical protein